jgi:hypothetical protein
MARNAQVRPKWLASIIVGSAALLLLAPSAAWADPNRHDYDRHRSHDGYQTHSEYRHHASHKRNHHASHKRNHHASSKRNHHASYKRNHHASHKRNHQRGKRHGYETQPFGYYCEPCNHYFSARDELYDHVAYRHDVPFRQLSVAVSFGAFGWIFFG